jgi:hypothetical protein
LLQSIAMRYLFVPQSNVLPAVRERGDENAG